MECSKEHDLTVVVGLDWHTLEQWMVSLPTIAANRTALLTRPWTIFYDYEQITSDDIRHIAEHNGLAESPRIRYVPWPEYSDVKYPSQRAKMLAGFVHVPSRHVETSYWMKVDTDVVATPFTGEWFDWDWFKDGVVLVASPWGYTKCKGDACSAAEWAESLECFGDACLPATKRIGLSKDVRGSNKIVRSRFWSPVSYYDSEFTRHVSEFCDLVCGTNQLPVPSQDTVHWYIAERAKMKYRTIRMQRYGWMFTNGMKRLQTAAEIALKGNLI